MQIVFSSNTFLYVFLPVVVVLFAVTPRRWRNAFLLLASLVFYSWGEMTWTWVLLISIVWNWGSGLLIGPAEPVRTVGRRRLLVVSVGANLAMLVWFKYSAFLVTTVNDVSARFGVEPLQVPSTHLPLGISFFTFHSISYVVDVYRGEMRPQRHLARLALYISLFPQLIAGPIVRYKEIGAQLDAERRLTVENLSMGATRFVRGLAKKVLIANPLGSVADVIFALPPDERGVAVAWVGILAYSLQIYFDFSGYSDMAIGLARMFGFRFPENFDHPYVARSIQDFWRRWHMSLSRWFRDYLYIPLGGNRRGPRRTYLNLYIVFFLCGLWHGPTWAFVAWGLLHGTFLALERTTLGVAALRRMPRPVAHAYALTVVLLAWVLFRAATWPEARAYYGSMFGTADLSSMAQPVGVYVTPLVALVLVVGIVLCMPIRLPLVRAARKRSARAVEFARPLLVPMVLTLCLIRLAADTYNPFIYFRF